MNLAVRASFFGVSKANANFVGVSHEGETEKSVNLIQHNY